MDHVMPRRRTPRGSVWSKRFERQRDPGQQDCRPHPPHSTRRANDRGRCSGRRHQEPAHDERGNKYAPVRSELQHARPLHPCSVNRRPIDRAQKGPINEREHRHRKHEQRADHDSTPRHKAWQTPHALQSRITNANAPETVHAPRIRANHSARPTPHNQPLSGHPSRCTLWNEPCDPNLGEL